MKFRGNVGVVSDIVGFLSEVADSCMEIPYSN